MLSCEICNYALTITKTTNAMNENKLIINEPNDFIKMFLNKKKKLDPNTLNNTVDLNFDIQLLQTQLKKMTATNNTITEEITQNIIKTFDNIKKNMKPNSFCLLCSNCNETFILPYGILSNIKLTQTINNKYLSNIDEILTDQTLYRTKDFICPNTKCKVSPIDKEAIIYRPSPNEYITQYICTNCKTIF